MTHKEDVLEQYKLVEKKAWDVITSSTEPLEKKAKALQVAIEARRRIDMIEMQNER